MARVPAPSVLGEAEGRGSAGEDAVVALTRAVHLQVALLDTGPVLACRVMLEPDTQATKVRSEVTCPFCRGWKSPKPARRGAGPT